MRTTMLVAPIAALLLLSGCSTGNNVTPEQKTAKLAKTIRLGSASATAIGFVAIPDEAEADKAANLTIEVLQKQVFPILNGDEAGFVAGFNKLRDLSILDDPKLSKVKMVLETVLPLLESNLPSDLADKLVGKVPADVKTYMTAFFHGVMEGAKSYLGGPSGSRGLGKYHAMREKLAE